MTASVTQSFTRAIMQNLQQFNIELDPSLRHAIDQYRHEDRLPMALQDALWQSLEATNNANLGLNIGLAMLPQSFDTMGFLLLSSPSLAVAVDSLVNFSPLVGEGGSFSKSHASNGWILRYDARFTVAVTLRIEAIFASIATGARWVAGKNITPVEIYFSHPTRADEHLYAQVFGAANIHFNHACNAIVYADDDWHFKQKNVNPAVQHQMLDLAQQQLDQLQPRNLTDKVEALLTRQPWLSRAQIATSLAMSERTLSRKLTALNSSYQDISQNIRKQQAMLQVVESDTTQATLAEYLGYSDESAFAKAFKRWTGMSFREYRHIYSIRG